MTLISVSIHDNDIYERHKKLFESNFNKYKLYKIIDKDNFSYNKKIFSNDIYLKESFYYPLKESELDRVSTIVKVNNNNNKIGGNISIKLDNKEIGSVNIYKKKINKKKDKTFLEKIYNKFKN